MRPWAWFRAFVGGYFWVACPVCGRKFGGHEDGGGFVDYGSGGPSTCPECPGVWVVGPEGRYVHPIDLYRSKA